jgi:serpin B
LDKYIQSLSGESFLELLNNKKDEAVIAALPKFKAEYSVELNKQLKALGLKDGFNPKNANFNKMGSCSDGNIYIGKVLHKTFISVDTKGTKVGAASVFDMKAGSAATNRTITLDRPFLYAIIDNETKLPLFIGAMERP